MVVMIVVVTDQEIRKSRIKNQESRVQKSKESRGCTMVCSVQ